MLRLQVLRPNGCPFPGFTDTPPPQRVEETRLPLTATVAELPGLPTVNLPAPYSVGDVALVGNPAPFPPIRNSLKYCETV